MSLLFGSDSSLPVLTGMPAPAIAVSLRRLSSAFAGSAVRVLRSSDSTQSDIGFTVAGDLDKAAAATFIGGGTGTAAKWYDQSGTNDFVQATAGNQPAYVASVLKLASRPALLFTDGGTVGMSAPSASAIDNMFAAGGLWMAVVNVTGAPTQIDRIVSKGVNVVEWRFASAASQQMSFTQAAATSAGAWTSSSVLTTTSHQIDVQYSSAALANTPTLKADRVTVNLAATQPVGTITTDAGSALFIGNANAVSRGFPGHIVEFIAWKTSVPTATQIDAIRANQRAYWGTA